MSGAAQPSRAGVGRCRTRGRRLSDRPADRRRHAQGRQGGTRRLGAELTAEAMATLGLAPQRQRHHAGRGGGGAHLAASRDFGGWQRTSAGAASGVCSSGLARPGASHRHGARREDDYAGVERGSSDFYAGFLRGLFDADGSVQGTQEKGVSVRLTQVDLPTLRAVQRMLLRLGIVSTIYRDRRAAGDRARCPMARVACGTIQRRPA